MAVANALMTAFVESQSAECQYPYYSLGLIAMLCYCVCLEEGEDMKI